MRRFLSFLFLFFVWSNISFAVTYKEFKSNPEKYYPYITGLYQGFGWSISMQEKIGPRFYCAPRTLSLNYENVIDILEKEVKRASKGHTKEELDKLDIGMLLAFGFKNTFPC
tara:strand:- start:264 stop:599 length:336 start_codon:yes stop_codon:yes gene_type:complete